jgi:hypothetical protein
MIKMITAVVAAAACAGVIITFAPRSTPAVAAGATQSAAHRALSSAMIEAADVDVIPTSNILAATARGQNLRNDSRNPKTVCEQSWPYYGQSCLRDVGMAAGKPRIVHVVVSNRSAAGGRAPGRH